MINMNMQHLKSNFIYFMIIFLIFFGCCVKCRLIVCCIVRIIWRFMGEGDGGGMVGMVGGGGSGRIG